MSMMVQVFKVIVRILINSLFFYLNRKDQKHEKKNIEGKK